MSNTLTGLFPSLFEAVDQVSREMVGFIPAVTRDNVFARAAVGQTVTSHVTPAAPASNITPGVTPPDDGDQALGNITMTLTKARRVPIRWAGEEQLAVNNNGITFNAIFRDQAAQAIRTLVNEIETDLAGLHVSASRAVGTAGTPPFGTAGDLSDTAAALGVLETNGAQGLDFQYVAGSAAMQNLRGKQTVLFKVNEAGSSDMLRNGMTDRLQNFALRNSAQVKTFTKGSGAGYLVNNAAAAIGDTVIPVDTGTGTILAGDVIQVAGDSNMYVVASALAAGSVTIAKPGLRVAPADNATVTLVNSSTRNLFFARSAIALATRLPALPVGGDSAVDRSEIQDPLTGLVFEIAVYRQYRQVQYEISTVWGVKATKSDFIGIGLG
jgi:hypothetical protein